MEHLTQSEMSGYRRRKLSADAMLAVDDHISACEPCRRALRQCEPMADAAAILSELGEPHLDYQEIEAYVDEHVGLEARRRIESHIELCGPCRQDVDDLRKFRLDSKTWAAPAPKQEPFRLSWSFPRLAAAFATLLVVTAIVWWWNSARQAPAILALNDGPVTGLAAADRAAMERALMQGALEVPESITALRGARTVVRAPVTDKGFALGGPIATAVLSDRPEFRWEPLPGAAAYRVAIFTADFHKVAESPWIESTAWTAVEPLERDRVYAWQVTARLGTGAGAPTVRAPALQDPEARFEVIGASEAAALERAARDHAGSHLLLGTLYARAGVLDLAEREFEALAAANPHSPQASALLLKIRQLRR